MDEQRMKYKKTGSTQQPQPDRTTKAPRLVLAATHSGSGKTMLTMGLLAAWKRRGVPLAAFKCGPDYIDPMFHSRVLGVPTRNLDGYFTDPDTTRALFARSAAPEDGISLIEGVMGYFDGAGLHTMQASACELAETLDAPVVLIVDAAGMSLSVAAIVKGFLTYREPSHIAGVIFNRMSQTVYEAVRPQIEAMGVRACGYVPRLMGMELPSRHLGLVTPQELKDLRAYTDRLADQLAQTVDLDALSALAHGAEPVTWSEPVLPQLSKELWISVARDEAFCFFYEDNLEYLKRIGAGLQFFSPLHDIVLPEHTDVLLFPGGYPELYAQALSENEPMRRAVYQALERGCYVLAECGGFLYLTKTLEDMDGHRYPMVGWMDAGARATGRLQRFGYIELTPQPLSAEDTSIRGHEFHYFDTDDNGADFLAKKPFRDVSWSCMHASGRGLIGFPHLYYYSNPMFLYGRLEQYTEEKAAEDAKNQEKKMQENR